MSSGLRASPRIRCTDPLTKEVQKRKGKHIIWATFPAEKPNDFSALCLLPFLRFLCKLTHDKILLLVSLSGGSTRGPAGGGAGQAAQEMDYPIGATNGT